MPLTFLQPRRHPHVCMAMHQRLVTQPLHRRTLPIRACCTMGHLRIRDYSYGVGPYWTSGCLHSHTPCISSGSGVVDGYDNGGLCPQCTPLKFEQRQTPRALTKLALQFMTCLVACSDCPPSAIHAHARLPASFDARGAGAAPRFTAISASKAAVTAPAQPSWPPRAPFLVHPPLSDSKIPPRHLRELRRSCSHISPRHDAASVTPA